MTSDDPRRSLSSPGGVAVSGADVRAAGRSPTRRRRLWLLRSLLTLGAAFLTLLLGEFALRGLVCVKARSMRPLFAPVVQDRLASRDDPIRHHALAEDAEFVATGMPPGLEYCVFGRTSPEGWNDDPLPPRRLRGERRALVLGDSFVESRQVPRGAGFCDLLERDLAARRDGPVRVINAGVGSYSTLLELLYYRQLRARTAPDVVLLVFFSNDVYDVLCHVANARWDDEGRPIAVKPGYVEVPLRAQRNVAYQKVMRMVFFAERPRAAEVSYVASLAHYVMRCRRLRNWFPEPPQNDQFFILEDDPALRPAQEHGWGLVRQFLALLGEECRKDQTQLILTAAPMASQVCGHSSYDRFFFRGRPNNEDNRRLRVIAGDLGIPFVDLLEPLRRGGPDLYYRRDGHWTPKGHAVVAKTLAPVLDKALQADAPAAEEPGAKE